MSPLTTFARAQHREIRRNRVRFVKRALRETRITFIDAATSFPEWIDIAIIIPSVIAFGGWIGYRTRYTLRAAFAGALTCVVFLMGAAGPVNTSSERGIQLFAGLLPVTLLFGAVYALVVALTARCRDSAPLSPPA